MSERRCPNCGGLVGADAEWCTQCFHRLDTGTAAEKEPVAEAGDDIGESTASSAPGTTGETAVEPGEAGGDAAPLSERETRPATPTGPKADLGERVIHSRGDRIVWDCPACGTENAIDSPFCSACGTPFRKVLAEPEEEIDVDPGRAAMWSLVFPGAGHIIVGRRGEGIARAVVFAFALMTGLVSLGAVTRGSGGAYLLLMVLALGAAAALYVISTLDAGRAATRLPPLLPSRVLMYGGIGLMLASLVVVVTGAMGARG